MEQISKKRDTWKEIMIKIDHFEKFGVIPVESPRMATVEGKAEIELQIKKNQDRCRKLRYDIRNKPSSPSVPGWQTELETLTADLKEFEISLIRLKYENAQPISS